MYVVRLLLVIMITLSAAVSGAMDAGHALTVEQSHAAMDEMADDQSACCSESSERTSTCHVLSALVPGTPLQDVAPVTCEDVFFSAGLLLTGFDPSGPLDPPRAV